jgi:hypothetical protein
MHIVSIENFRNTIRQSGPMHWTRQRALLKGNFAEGGATTPAAAHYPRTITKENPADRSIINIS